MPAPVSIRIEQPSTAMPASVYDVLMELDRWPDFMPGVSMRRNFAQLAAALAQEAERTQPDTTNRRDE